MNKIPLVILLAVLAIAPATAQVNGPGGPIAATATQFALTSTANTDCTSVTGKAGASLYTLAIGGTPSGTVNLGTSSQTTAAGPAIFKAQPIQVTTTYALNAWTVPLAGVQTGTGGFSAQLAVLGAPNGSGACSFTAVTPAIPVAPNALTVSLTPTLAFKINKGESLALVFQDRVEPLGTPHATILGLGTPGPLGLPVNTLSSPVLPAAYPVPGPAAWIVMALGAAAVALFVRRARMA